NSRRSGLADGRHMARCADCSARRCAVALQGNLLLARRVASGRRARRTPRAPSASPVAELGNARAAIAPHDRRGRIAALLAAGPRERVGARRGGRGTDFLRFGRRFGTHRMTANPVALSIERGCDRSPLLEVTIGAAFDRMAATQGDREALVVRHQGIRWSWRELARRVDAVASGLLALGLERGDRVGIWAPNCAEWVVLQFATAKAGLVLVNINPAYRIYELEYALRKVGCRALVLAPHLKTSDYLAMIAELAPELIHASPGDLRAKRLPDLKYVIRLGAERTAGTLNFDELADLGRAEHRIRLAALAQEISPNEAVNIQFTSGTTGAPKGATLTHRNILNNGFFVGQALGLSTADRVCIPVPLYHCFGMVMGNLACIAHGATMVYPAELFEPGAVLSTVQDERCTTLYGVPTMFVAELNHPEFSSFDLSSLRTGIMAGAPCPIEVMKRVVSEMHMPEVTIAYGMTETSPVSTQSSRDDELERRVSTVGRVHPH